MDSENHLIEEMKKLIPYIQEDFLISLTNKGIVNRSKKDLEKIKATISFSVNENGLLQGKIGDEVTVVLDSHLQNSTCTCPSQSICKHIITCLLYVKEYYEAHGAEQEKESITLQEEATTIPPYEALNTLTEETLQALIGKKEYNAILRSIQLKQEAEFTYDDLLTVTLSSQNSKVYFPKENSLENMMCSCKEKGICRHKAYALLSYCMQERHMELHVENDVLLIGAGEQELLERIKKYVGTLLDRGLTGVTENEIQNVEKLYQRAYGMKMFQTAAECKALSAELALYFSKNIGFSMKKTMHLLCTLYNRAEAMLIKRTDGKKIAVLAGKRREESYSLDQLHFWGLGASCRSTQRKDLLINAYFYCEELQSMHILSTMRPPDRQGVEYLYHAGILWADEYPISRMCESKVLLKEAKISPGRLSSAKSTVCQVKGTTGEKEFEQIAVSDFQWLKERLKKESFQYFTFSPLADSIYLLKVARVDEIAFDKVEQKLKFEAYDENDHKIDFEIKYSAVTENAIRFWERNKDTNVFSYILGSIREKGGSLQGEFLSGVHKGKIHNVYFKNT